MTYINHKSFYPTFSFKEFMLASSAELGQVSERLTIGEGYFSYGVGRERHFPRIVIKMMEKEPVKDFATKVGTKPYLVEKYKGVIDVWGCSVYGLRCVLLSTFMYPHITGKRKEMCKYFYEKGYMVTPKEVEEFAKKFGARRAIIRTSKEGGSEIIEEDLLECKKFL